MSETIKISYIPKSKCSSPDNNPHIEFLETLFRAFKATYPKAKKYHFEAPFYYLLDYSYNYYLKDNVKRAESGKMWLKKHIRPDGTIDWDYYKDLEWVFDGYLPFKPVLKRDQKFLLGEIVKTYY